MICDVRGTPGEMIADCVTVLPLIIILRVAPDQIPFPAPVDASTSDDLPGQWNGGCDDRCLCHMRAVHDPDRHISVLGVTPNEVTLTVAVDIANAGHLPDVRHV